MIDKGCNRCRAGVLEVVAAAMNRRELDLSAGVHCDHCGTAWFVAARPMVGEAKAEFLTRLQAAPHSQEPNGDGIDV